MFSELFTSLSQIVVVSIGLIKGREIPNLKSIGLDSVGQTVEVALTKIVVFAE